MTTLLGLVVLALALRGAFATLRDVGRGLRAVGQAIAAAARDVVADYRDWRAHCRRVAAKRRDRRERASQVVHTLVQSNEGQRLELAELRDMVDRLQNELSTARDPGQAISVPVQRGGR